jgi:hypothetical protein
MILVTHIVAGAAVAKPFIDAGHPLLGITAAVASHYILDQIPHWDYDLSAVDSDEKNKLVTHYDLTTKNILTDLLKLSLDAGLGFLIVFLSLFFSHSVLSISYTLIAISCLASAFPDLLQAVYWFYPKFPILQLKKFHIRVHAKKKLGFTPIAILSQVGIILLSIFSLT